MRPRGPRTRRGLAAVAAAAAAAVLVLAGCAGAGDETLAGFGLPVQPEEGVPGPRRPVSGVLRVEHNGCFTLEDAGGARRWLVWPRDARHDDDHVVLGDGTAVGDGAVLVGEGARVDAAALPDFTSDGYYGSFGRFCGADELGVVVLDEVRADA